MTEVATRAFLPISQRRLFRVKIVNFSGQVYAELNDFMLGTLTWAVSDMGVMDFTVAADDPQVKDIVPPRREVQVWLGDQIIWWGVLVRARGDSRTITFQAYSLEWYFTKRVIGKVPIPNLLRNGSFEQGEAYWDYTFADGSIPAAPPGHELSSTTLNGPRAVKLTGSSKVEITTTTTVTSLSGDVTFAFDSSSLSDAGRQALSAIASTVPDGTVVTIVGHTDSNASHSYNQNLSEQRAQSVQQYVASINPNITVNWTAKGETQPVASNTTEAGRAANRRVDIAYDQTTTTTVEATGHRQFARQRIRYTNPRSAKTPKYLTLSAWCYIESFETPAKDGWALYLERLTPEGRPITGEERYVSPNPSPTALTTAVNIISAKAFVSISSETPQKRWLRMECTIGVPANDVNYIIEARLYPPGGVAIWDEVTLTASDALAFHDEEQAVILKGLVDHAQDPAMGKTSLNIGTRVAATGVKRTREWLWSERALIYDGMQDFATLADGMEWQVTYDATTRQVQSYFPRMGDDTGVTLALGDAIALFTVDVDGTRSANQVIVQAEGEGSDREEGYATDLAALEGLLLETVYNATPGSSISSLTAQANRGLKRYRNPVTIPSITLTPERFEEFFDRLTAGDRVRVLIQKGWINVDAMYRITTVTLAPKTRTMTLTITPEDAPL